MSQEIAGCIIAGGLARRMRGEDKGQIAIGSKTILARIIERVGPQVGCLALNANGDPTRDSGAGIPVIGDTVAGQQGPLAGLLAAMDWSPSPLLLTVPGDTPFLPSDLVERLAKSAAGRACAIASSGGKRHPVCGLWNASLADGLRQRLGGGLRRVEAFTAELDCGIAAWPVAPYDPFLNINTPEDVGLAQQIAAEFHL